MTLFLYPYGDDLLARAAEHLLARAGDALPDLSNLVVLVADVLAAEPLRRQLQDLARQRGHEALIGLRVTTLRDWVEQRAADDAAPLNAAARRLLLVEALRQHRDLFGEDDPWRLADSLLELFDELALHCADLSTSTDPLTERLARGYRVSAPPPDALAREAQIVQRLWQAWQEQTDALGRPDPHLHYLRKLGQAPSGDEPFFLLVGPLADAPAERAWVTARLQSGRAEWLLQGNSRDRRVQPDRALDAYLALAPGADDVGIRETERAPHPRARFLDAVYPHPGQCLRERAAGLAAEFPDSPMPHLATLYAGSAEQEARAIDIQVRRWLLEGRARIGIVTQDRRLARRLRALLERAGVLLQDSGGWALSTTSAAACLERWLQCVEEDFAYQPLLDLLKSPFFSPAADRAAHLASVYRLEHDIIQHENIGRGMERYRRHIEYRRHRLQWPAELVEPMHALLDRLEKAARPLLRLRTEIASAQLFLAQLRVSLGVLGVWTLLDGDAAGQRVLQLWEELDAASRQIPLMLTWQEFRVWLGRGLEEKSFRPGPGVGPVQLLTLEQSQLLTFDAVAVGACDREHLPGRDRATPFFNSQVRRELGLPTWEHRLDRRLYQFRRLLEAAPNLLLTCRREEQGEPVLPSPWLEALETLHRLAWRRGLEDTELKALSQSERCTIAMPEPAPPPSPPRQPRPRLPASLVPTGVSASSHQHLIDCPYRYFAADGLQLAPAETVRERLQKSDYGERVHQCLEAFHANVEGLPGPFGQPFVAANRDAAIDLLRRIAEAVFARDLEDNFQHRGWLKRWLRLIPSYVDWQIKRTVDWRVQAVEQRVEREFDGVGTLLGRLDRIDSGGGRLAIVDYKTGRVPRQDEVDAGEAVQLPFYALLSEAPIEQVEYLRLEGDRVAVSGGVSGEALVALRDAVATRLVELTRAIDAGDPLPAWGDPDACRYCPMEGVCRRPGWE